MTGRVLLGPCLTRAEAAERAGLPASDLPFRPDLIHIGGHLLPEAYCRFQFGPYGIRSDIGTIVLAMRGSCDDLTIADWLVAPNPGLYGASPLAHLNRTHRPGPVLDALAAHPPHEVDADPTPLRPAESRPLLRDLSAQQRRPRRRWKTRVRPAAASR